MGSVDKHALGHEFFLAEIQCPRHANGGAGGSALVEPCIGTCTVERALCTRTAGSYPIARP
jgi:hypothetical protein